MTYIILELFPTPFIVTNVDGEVWKTDLTTAKEVVENCQQGMVVPLDPQLMKDIEHAYITDKGSCLTQYIKNEPNT